MKKGYRLGFWSETQDDSVRQIQSLPEIIANSCPITANFKLITINDSIVENINPILLRALQANTETAELQITAFQCAKVSEVTVTPKSSSQAGLMDLDMYHVCYMESGNQKINFFFLIDKNNKVAGYTHFSYLENSTHLELAYSDFGFLAVDSIESTRRDDYPLGTLLFQTAFEQSLRAGYEGRISLFSANKSGGFYFKLGLTALKEPIFDALYYKGQKEIGGDIMFLTAPAIEAWQERVRTHPILENPKLLEDIKDLENNKIG